MCTLRECNGWPSAASAAGLAPPQPLTGAQQRAVRSYVQLQRSWAVRRLNSSQRKRCDLSCPRLAIDHVAMPSALFLSSAVAHRTNATGFKQRLSLFLFLLSVLLSFSFSLTVLLSLSFLSLSLSLSQRFSLSLSFLSLSLSLSQRFSLSLFLSLSLSSLTRRFGLSRARLKKHGRDRRHNVCLRARARARRRRTERCRPCRRPRARS